MKRSETRLPLGYLLVGIGAAMMLVVAACAPAAPPPAPAVKEAPKAEAPAPKPEVKPAAPAKGGIVVYGQPRKPPSWDVLKEDIAPVSALSGVYDYLVMLPYKAGLDYRADRNYMPGLATKWEQPTPDSYVFTLREGVKWHDGKPFTMEDVLFSLDEWRNKEKAPRPYTVARHIAKVEKLSESQVKITIKEVNPDFLAEIGYYSNQNFIVAKHVADRRSEIIGTGPFKVKSADLKTGVVVERNPDFWDKDKPYLEGGKVFVAMDAQALQAAFIAGEFDLLNFQTKPEFDAVKAMVKDVQSEVYAQTHNNSLHFKQDEPPFNGPGVRKAVDLAIDRQALVQDVTFGLGLIGPPAGLGLMAKAGWGIPLEELQKLPGYRQPKDPDIAEAKRLLKEAGYPDGFTFEVYYAKDRTTTPPIAEAVIPMLKKVGIEMKLRPIERGVYLAGYLADKRQFPVVMDLTAGEIPTPRLSAWFHSKGVQNFARINDPKLDSLIEAQAKELDVAKRKQLMRQVQELIYQNTYSVPTIDHATIAAFQPWLKGYPGCFCAQAFPTRWENMSFDLAKAPKRKLD